MSFSLRASIALVASVVLCAQDTHPKSKAEFEVASLRPSAALTNGPPNFGLHIDGAQLRCTYFSLIDYIGIAYKVKNYQVSGPDWLLADHFDLAAKLPPGSDRAQVNNMLQTLLTDRFKLKFHREPKPLPVNALIIAKGGLKLTPLEPNPVDPISSDFSVGVGGSRGGFNISYGKDAYFAITNNKIEVKSLTMPVIADFLSRFVDKPIVDMTDTKGAFSFTMEFSPDDFRGMLIHAAASAGVQLPPQALQAIQGSSEASLYTALRNVGLNLESRKAPLDVIVVDSIEKTPTEN